MIDDDGKFNWAVLGCVIVAACAAMVYLASMPYGNEGSNEPAVTPIFPTERN